MEVDTLSFPVDVIAGEGVDYDTQIQFVCSSLSFSESFYKP